MWIKVGLIDGSITEMISDKTLLKFWGERSFVQLDRKALRNTNIPKSGRSFLARVCLPKKLGASDQALGIYFEVEKDNLPTLAEHADDEGTELPKKLRRQELYRIGGSFEADLCLNEEGRVLLIQLDLVPPDLMALNSSIKQLLEFLYIYEKYTGKGRGLSVDELDTLKKQQEREFRRADPVAVDHPEKWWSVVIEEIGYGLL